MISLSILGNDSWLTALRSSKSSVINESLHSLSTLKQAITRLTLNLSRESNSLLSINRLPEEIIVAILTNVCREESSPISTRIRVGLMKVQSRWLDLISSSPRFWTQISNVEGETMFRLKLKRSKEALLDVNITNEYDPGFSRTFINVEVSQLSRRWRSLRFSDVEPDILQPLLVRGTAPALETVHIHNEGPTHLELPFFDRTSAISTFDPSLSPTGAS